MTITFGIAKPTGNRPHTPLQSTQFSGIPSGTQGKPEKTDRFQPTHSRDTVRFGSSQEAEAVKVPALDASQQPEADRLAKDYVRFLTKATCAPWTAKIIAEMAEKEGFKRVPKEGIGKAKPGDKFIVNQGNDALALIVIGEADPVQSGFSMIGAHLDSPQLYLKPKPGLNRGGLHKLQTMTHGGLILPSWYNRDLGLSGRVFAPERDKNGRPKTDQFGRPVIRERFVHTGNKAVGTITSLPIHLDREMNSEGMKMNREYHASPVVGLDGDAESQVKDLLEQARINPKGDDTTLELYLHDTNAPKIVGQKGSMINGQGHDDRSMCYAAVKALFDATAKQPPRRTNIVLLFNDEEIGNNTRNGAASAFSQQVIEDILSATGKAHQGELSRQVGRALSESMLLSADVAHAFDPDRADKYDRERPVLMGHGPAIKINHPSYATRAKDLAGLKAFVEWAGVPAQVMSPNQDVGCGSTIGPDLSSKLNLPTVDIGAGLLSMHNIREVMASKDLFYTKQLFERFLRGDR
ncbi:MAG TPA: hypothetical protein V6C52_14270 [Coleofasciculaceae cyanobacterium]|jgi:aspartyl aminopeptidase